MSRATVRPPAMVGGYETDECACGRSCTRLNSELRCITTNGAHSEANRALCAEVLGRVAAGTTA